jgi:hypothetical protein
MKVTCGPALIGREGHERRRVAPAPAPAPGVTDLADLRLKWSRSEERWTSSLAPFVVRSAGGSRLPKERQFDITGNSTKGRVMVEPAGVENESQVQA